MDSQQPHAGRPKNQPHGNDRWQVTYPRDGLLQITFFDTNLRPLVERVVSVVLTEVTPQLSELKGRLSFSEAEAAALLGIERHVLRDCRLCREIIGVRLGKRIVYERTELERFLVARRMK